MMNVPIDSAKAPIAPPQAPQGWVMVWKAEVRRLARQGGLRRSVLWAFALAVALGVTTLVTVTWMADGKAATPTRVSSPGEVAAATAAFVLALAATVHFGRSSQNGSVQSSLVLVPNRTRLLLAQGAASATLGAATALAAAVVAGLASVVSTGASVGLREVATGLATGPLAAALLTALGFLVGTVLNRAVGAVLVTIGWWLVMPLVIMVAGAFLPAAVQPVVQAVLDATPTMLLPAATSASELSTSTWQNLVQAHGLLCAWVVGMGALAWVLLRRRAF